MNNVILLRHGEALHNVFPDAWKFGDEQMLTLTEKGYVQAIKAAHTIVGKLDLQKGDELQIVSSDLMRARQTTHLVKHVLRTEHGVTCIENDNVDLRQSLREFYTVFDGNTPKNFNYNQFLEDPFLIHYNERNDDHEQFPKIRNPLEMMIDHSKVYQHVMLKRTHTPVLVVGHHFNLNILRLLFHFKGVCGESQFRNLFEAWICTDRDENQEASKSGMDDLRKLLVQAMTMPLSNAHPTPAFHPGTCTLDNETLTDKIHQWLQKHSKKYHDQLPVS